MNYNKKTVMDVDVSGKKVLLRCDFNVPQDKKTGAITSDKRIVAALPTIRYLLEHGAAVIACSHLGKPEPVFDKWVKKQLEKGKDPAELTEDAWKKSLAKLTLAPIAERLSELLGQEVLFAHDVVGEDATAKAEQAAQITSEIYALQRKISDESVRQAELDAQIAEAKRRGYDSTLSTKEQADALAQATELIRQKYQGPAGIITLESQLADKMAELNNVVSSTPAQIDAANQQRVKANQAAAQYNNTLRELSERSKTVTTNLTKQREELERMAALRQSIASLELSTPDITMPQGAKALTEEGIKVPVRAEVDQESFFNVTSQVASLAEGLSSTIGGLLGDLITGGDAWGNFRDAALSAFADMAVSIGKLAVAAGTAALGISQALKTPSKGAIAIAAGAALIALGAAVKAGLSNISAGNYSSTSSVASGSYGATGTSDYTKQEIQIKVSGTLKGSGRDILAAIESAQEARLITT